MGGDVLGVEAVPREPLEHIPATSPAERVVADELAIGTTAECAERVRDSVPLWFHTFALAPGIYTPGIARDHGYRLPVMTADRFAGLNVGFRGPWGTVYGKNLRTITQRQSEDKWVHTLTTADDGGDTEFAHSFDQIVNDRGIGAQPGNVLVGIRRRPIG